MTTEASRNGGLRERADEQPAFPTQEHRDRVQRAQTAMAGRGLALLILFDPNSLGYFTGYTSVNLWDFSALVLGVEGDPRVVLWDFEVPRFEVSANLGQLYVYSSHSDPVPVLAQALEGLPCDTYAIDDWTMSLPVELWNPIRALVASGERRDAREILWATRLRKSPQERDILRQSATLTDIGVRAAQDALHEGATDRELAAVISGALLEAGSEHPSIAPIVAAGPRAGVPHSGACGRRIQRGESVFVELGGCVSRYTAPLMRTLVVGEPETELTALAETAVRAGNAAASAMQPGTPASTVARVAQEIIDADPTEILFHRSFGYPVGHAASPTWFESLGFLVHEGNDTPLEEGMVFHIPLSLRHRGVRGVGASHTVEITADGPRTLSRIPPDLWIKA